jgi:hypothetical protein
VAAIGSRQCHDGHASRDCAPGCASTPRLQITYQDFVKIGAVEGFLPQNTTAFGQQRQKTAFTIQTGGIKSPDTTALP